MDRDKAIRAAKLTIGGMLEKNRHATAVGRAGGQVSPSKYLPDVPRAVHADGGRENGDSGHIYVVHGGSDFDQIDPSYSGRGEPGGIRPLGKGLYGYILDHADPERAERAINGAKMYSRKYGSGTKTLHVYKVPKTVSTSWNGLNEFDRTNVPEYPPEIKGLGGLPKKELAEYEAHARSEEPKGDDYWSWFRKKNQLSDRVKQAADMQLQHLPIGITEAAIQNPKVATRIGKFGVDTPTSDILDAVKSDARDGNITKADGGRVGYGNGGKSLGLYSKAAQVIRNQPQAKGSVDQLLAMVSKTKGVKPAELSNAGRPAGKTMSKEELAKHFEDALPDVQVMRKGRELQTALNALMQQDRRNWTQKDWDKANALHFEAQKQPSTRYDQYTLPGGENYREHLLHLPRQDGPIAKRLKALQGQWQEAYENQAPREDLDRMGAKIDALSEDAENEDVNFKSDHWQTPNVLAHVRMSDRDNGKTLHVHEVQSDWGQAGREQGFHDPENPYEVINKKTREVVSKHPDFSSMWDAYRTNPNSDSLDYGDYSTEKPPQGPYVGNTQQWTDLALKHVLMEAAKGGHDRVVFSPGEANADMYGQRKEMGMLKFLKSKDSGEAGVIVGYSKDGRRLSPHKVDSHAEVEKLIGKENATNLLAQPQMPAPEKSDDSYIDTLQGPLQQGDSRYTHTLQGPLTVGGHGMIDYYKNFAHQGALKLLQQHDPSIKPESYDLPNDYKGFALPMTDTARESILKNGFQAFQRGGEVHKADGGSVTDNENFQNWFGNSVTHTDGQPHVFYTGTSKDKDFTSHNVGRHGAWFTRDPEVASQYAEQNDSQGYKRDGFTLTPTNTASRVIPAYVKAENPYTGELPEEYLRDNYKAAQSEWFDTLRAKGHDSWIPSSQGGNLVVALKEPQQIKSIFNSGKFDPNQKHMNKAAGGQVMGYVPMASLTVPRLAVARAPVQQQQAPAARFSESLNSLMDTVEGFKKKPDAAADSPSAATEGHGPQGMSEAAAAAYGKLTDAWGQPLTVVSAYRDPEKNQEVGGAKGSQHLHGNAYDIDTSGLSYEDRLRLADEAWNAGFRGIGFYDNNMHFDVGDPRAWGSSHSRDSIPEWAQPFTQERYGYAFGGRIGKDDGGSVDDDIPNIKNPMSVFPKPQRMFPEDQRPAGGQYLSAHNKADVTGHKAESASIGIGPNGKPFFQASQNAVDQTGTSGRGSATVKTNLFKKKAGWKWENTPDGHENTDTIVSVEHRGKHIYALNAHFPRGVDLARYENSPSEPRLRPTTQGNVTLGPQAGSISVRGKMHPVYHHVIVKAAGGTVDAALALTLGFTKDGKSAISALKTKGK